MIRMVEGCIVCISNMFDSKSGRKKCIYETEREID